MSPKPTKALAAENRALQAQVRELQEALHVAANALDIADDWHVPELQCNPPKAWALPAREEDKAEGWCSTAALAAKLRSLAGTVPPAEAPDYLKQACWLALEHDCYRYLMANAHGRRDGALKADCHQRLCLFYVAVWRCLPDTSWVRRQYEADYRAVHRHTQQLTDRLDEVIGFPLQSPPDYHQLVPQFFEHFHRLALEAL